MRSVALPAAWSLLVVGCSTGSGTGDRSSQDSATATSVPARHIVNGDTIARLPFRIIEDNVQHDTLAIQVTFDLKDGYYMMVASNVEENDEGLRLVYYRFTPEGAVEIIDSSPPAYDSWTLLPTFFSDDGTADGMWVLANVGEKQSWGQRLFWVDVEFADMGFIDVAHPERVVEGDTAYLKRGNISPYTRYAKSGDTAVFTFASDSVYLYDDQNGHQDLVLPASSVRYTFHHEEGLALWLNGRKQPMKKPA